MVTNKKLDKKIIALLLSGLMIVGMIPTGLVMSFAASIDDFTVKLGNYSKSAAVTLTNADSADDTMTVNAEDGEAVFNSFIDDEKIYNIEITDLIGYNDYSASGIAVEGRSLTIDNLVELETYTVSGAVVDENSEPASNAEISYSAYDGEIEDTVKTDKNGTYSFDVYKNIEYSISIDAGKKYQVKTDTVTASDGDVSLSTYTLEVKQFSIIANVGSNGSVSDSSLLVDYGTDAIITVTADENYRIENLTVDNTDITEAVGESEYDCEFTNVKETHEISATFYRPTYEITINYNSNGEVKDNSDNPVSNGGAVTLYEGDEAGFTAIPFENYHIGNVCIDGEDVNESWSNDYGNYTYTFNDNKKHSVTITFEINTFIVNITCNENGQATVDNSTVDYDGDAVITITPNTDYDVESVFVNDEDFTETLTENEDGTYTLSVTNVTEDKTVEVSFAEIEKQDVEDVLNNSYYTVTFSKDPVVIGNQYIVANGESITVTPTDSYKRVRVNGSYLPSNKGASVTYNTTTEINTIEVSTNSLFGGWKIKTTANISFTVDSTAPTIDNVTKTPTDDYYNTSYNINIDVSDDCSGIEDVLYSTENDITTAISATLSEDKTSAEFTTTDDEFNGTYYIWAVDAVGNTSNPSTIDIAIDKTAPTIDNFEFSSDSLNACEFGTFSNSDIDVVITASDDDSALTNSGIKSITFNGETKETDTNNQATFTLNADDFAAGKEVSATVIDYAGNSSDVTVPTSDNSNIISNIVTISSTQAVIDVAKDSAQKYVDGESYWYAGDNTFKVTVSDDLGLKSVVIKMNGETVVEETLDAGKSVLTSKEYNISTSENALDGENEITVDVVNVVSNASSVSDKVYIDTTNPDIIDFEFTSKGTSALSKVLNFLTFGNYFNEEIEIKVTANDENASSGLKEITLFGDKEVLATTEVDENNIAVFTVPADKITDENMMLNVEISAKATDNVGNITEAYVYPTTTNSDTFQNSGLMIETVKPIINVELESAASDKNKATTDKNDWYADDVDFNITLTDSDSGIRFVTIKINDTDITTDKASKQVDTNFNELGTKTTELTYTVNTDQAKINKDGSYVLEITVTDNAGNVNTYTKTIFKDIDNPSIVSFTFDAKGNQDADGSNTTVQVMDYGFYFVEDTEVTVTANDVSPTSGIKSITYYTVDKDGGKSEETTKLVDKNNQISFTVPANFKGQIYAKATDNVENSPSEYVNPNSSIIETPEQHKKTSSITYTLKDTPYTDDEGNNLYSDTTTVDVEIVDSYSGIRQIDWKIIADYDDKKQAGTVTVNNSGKVTSVAKDGYSNDCLGEWEKTTEANLVTKLTNTITVSNDCNNIQIVFTLTDRAGNVTKNVVQTLSIDKTSSKITVVMNDNDDDDYSGYFKVNRTAKITVNERNFDNSKVVFIVTKTDDDGNKTSINIEPSFTVTKGSDGKLKSYTDENGIQYYKYTMSYTFKSDGDYTFNISSKDKVERNNAAVKYSHKSIDTAFTIDKTNPTISVSYDNNSASNSKYFNAYRTATITIVEHNFTQGRITYTTTSQKDGATISTPSVSAWKTNGNTHTATITYNADGDYTFDVSVVDKANNKSGGTNYGNSVAPKDFTIDTTVTNPVIGGVENGQSYKEDVIPTITVDDVNFSSYTVELLRTRKDEINVDVTEEYIKNQPSNRQTVSNDTFDKVQENDGIYTLTVSLTDMAGNQSSESVTFTVNRFGSVYAFNNYLVGLKDTYQQSIDNDIVITEYNPDRLTKGSLEVIVTRDNSVIEDLSYTVNPVVNDSAAIGSSGWYQYEYAIDASNFAQDGIYTVFVQSVDTVGNNSRTSNYDECKVLFRVDATTPEFMSVDGFDEAKITSSGNAVINALTNKFDFEVYDSIGLSKVEVYINDMNTPSAVYEYGTDEFEDLNSFFGSFELSEGANQEIKLIAYDQAGNSIDTSSDDFAPTYTFSGDITISTNFFVRWYADKALFWGSIAVMAVLVIALIIIIIIVKRKKDNDDK
ncbi:MAG: carboxypeptidase-like regulatory domain-containing protein [Clostridiales bacterium]|nr:carboxypeptidase-like regulatory domain-containing protein [Clostridiales bacterium]